MGQKLMKHLKWLAIAAVVLYAGWIAWPVFSDLVFGTDAPVVPSMRQDVDDYTSRTSAPSDGGYTDAVPLESIQGETAVAAMETQNIPVVALWGGVIAFYLLSAFLHANNNIRAAFAYVFAFVADLVLTYLTKGQAGSGLYDKILEVLSGWDPRYVLTLVALVMGFVIYMTRHPEVLSETRKKFAESLD